MVQRYTTNVSQQSLEQEVQTSLEAYRSLWSARVRNLSAFSRVISSMSDVRAAFLTRDRATIQDTAEQLWSRGFEQDARFLVLDPTGQVIASLTGTPEFILDPGTIEAARARFPAQVSGYLSRGSQLFYVVLTPVYVQAQQEQGLLNVLLMAFQINDALAQELKQSTHGSEFIFTHNNSVAASTLKGIDLEYRSRPQSGSGIRRLADNGQDYLVAGTELRNMFGKVTSELFIARSFAGPSEVLSQLRRSIAAFWVAGLLVALGLTYLLSVRILGPVRRLDQAAAEVAKRNYEYRIPVETKNELGRLATTFNAMCDSIQTSREELIRQEQIATIGRLSTSIAHDLRNPLAAIYGGAEMLVDGELSTDQSRRLAASIYASSRRIQELLQQLLDVARAGAAQTELCRLADIAAAACEDVAQAASLRSVEITVDVPSSLLVLVSRDRLQRVFVNLIGNAIDAMPRGGRVSISGRSEDAIAVVTIEDTGPGIEEKAWPHLFKPFASFGKKNGLGLGLALSRQTLLDCNGELWAERVRSGARFVMRLPLATSSTSPAAAEQVLSS
jgi:signal transduction histidine kinase